MKRWLCMVFLLAMVLVMAASPRAYAHYLVCDRDESHDIYEIDGLDLTGVPIAAEAVDHRLHYNLDSLHAGVYAVKVRAFSYVLQQWSSYSDTFFFRKTSTGDFVVLVEGVPTPKGIGISES